MKKFKQLLITASLLILSSTLFASDSNSEKVELSAVPVDAVWQYHKEKFHLNSFHNYYSCDGIENKVERLLTELGARNVKARASGCFEMNGQLGKSLRIRVEFESLTSNSVIEGEPVKAAIQEVHIRPNHPRGVSLGDCELIDELQNNILDNFDHEVVKKNRTCFPGTQSLGDVDWKVKVLKAMS